MTSRYRTSNVTIHKLTITHSTCTCIEVSLEEKVNGDIKEDNASNYFGILQVSCETRIPRLMEVALDAVHYLIGNE
jgi:hypothetical protein